MYDPPDYDAIEASLWKKSAEEVVPLLKKQDKNILQKIKTFSDNFGYDIDDVKTEIRDRPMFAASFATKPNRTGFHEKIAQQWLRDNLGLEVEKLPSQGAKALYVSNDGVIGTWDQPGVPPSKSLDFRWCVGKYTFFAMHKFTRGDGGAQGHQYRDVLNTLRQFMRAQDRNVILIGIVDGSYYSPEKMEKLRSDTRPNPPYSFATRIEGVPEIVKKYRT